MSNEKQKENTLTYKATYVVAFWKLVEYTGLILFLALIPRSMTPELYGDFALILSILGLLILASTLGGQQTFVRFIPEFKADGNHRSVTVLFTQFFMLRLFFSLFIIAVTLGLLTYLKPEFDQNVAIGLSLAYFCGAVSLSCMHLFYGLNKIGLFLLHGSSSRILLVFLLMFYWVNVDLGKAAISLALVEVFLMVFLLIFAWKYLAPVAAFKERSALYSHLKYGMSFFISNLLMISVWRSGEIMIASLNGESEQVAFFNLSNSIFLALYALLALVASVLLPSINLLHVAGEHEKRDRWLGDTLKYLTILTFIALLGINAVGEPIFTLLLGEEFSQVTVNLQLISITLIPLNLVFLGSATAMVHSKLREYFLVTSTALVSYLIAAGLLTPAFGAIGASGAALISGFVAATLSYQYFNLKLITRLAEFNKIVVIGALCLSIVSFSGLPHVYTGIILSVVFVGSMFSFGIIRINDLKSLLSGKDRKPTSSL